MIRRLLVAKGGIVCIFFLPLRIKKRKRKSLGHPDSAVARLINYVIQLGADNLPEIPVNCQTRLSRDTDCHCSRHFFVTLSE